MTLAQKSKPSTSTLFGPRDVVVKTPGGKLFARIWGRLNAEKAMAPIILFHDSLGAVDLWRDFPAHLANATGHPVIAYDRLGFGQSDPYPGRLGHDFIFRESQSSLPALRQQLGINSMILFGHSVGGAMAVTAGAAYSNDCIAVITESAQAFVEDRTLTGIREAQQTFNDHGQVERLARYHGEKARWVLDAWIETWLAPDFAEWALNEELRRLRCPVLAIHGDRDEFGSDLHPERIAKLSGGQSVIFEDCGHVPHRQKPEKVLETVSAFLAKLPA